MAELVEAAEAVESVVEPVMTEVIKTVHTVDRRIAVAAMMISAAGGAGAAWFFASARLRKTYAQQAEAEIDSMREHFRARLMAREEKPDLSALTQKVAELKYGQTAGEDKDTAHAKAVVQGDPGSPNGIAVPPAVRNIFQEAQVVDNWDWETEKALRDEDPDRPFVIHVDERHEHADDYAETTLTYYEADDVLCDENDKVVDDHDLVVGLINLDRFGHGSKDANIVYVRNPQLAMDIEVVRSRGSYAEEVHGFTPAPETLQRRRGASEPDD